MRALVVDDDPVVRKRLCDGLAADGHEAVEARDGAEALLRLEGGGLDAVVTGVPAFRQREHELETSRTSLVATHEALRQSEERFQQFFFACPVASCLTDLATGRFLEVNDSSTELFGYEREELIGHTSVELGLWADLADRARMVEAVSSGIPFHGRVIQLRSKSGKALQILCSAELLPVGKERVLFSSFHATRHPAGHHGAEASRRPVPAGTEDGGVRQPGERNRARFQQSADPDPRLQRHSGEAQR